MTSIKILCGNVACIGAGFISAKAGEANDWYGIALACALALIGSSISHPGHGKS